MGELADLAQGVMRRKLDALVMACDGQFTGEHAEMCVLHLAAYDHLAAQIAELDVLADKRSAPFTHLIAKLVTIPGIGVRTAQVIVAETGGDMSKFPAPGQLAAWCGLALPTGESAGKRMRAGNQHPSAAMVEAAWSTGRTKTRPGARLRRLIRRFGEDGKKKAAVSTHDSKHPGTPPRSAAWASKSCSPRSRPTTRHRPHRPRRRNQPPEKPCGAQAPGTHLTLYPTPTASSTGRGYNRAWLGSQVSLQDG